MKSWRGESGVKAVVAGLGYVGLPLAMRAVAARHQVTGCDTDPVRVKRLEAGESCVEDVPPGELAAALESGRFRPAAQASACADSEVTVPVTRHRPCARDASPASRASSGPTRRTRGQRPKPESRERAIESGFC
jgi:UDP-N-acetyl-D-glucosamine dehydrogenase